MKKYPPVVVVNEQDDVIGEAPLAEAREQGLIYRIVFVVIEDGAGRVLLQKRAAGMPLFPGCWDISCGGHVDGGRTYEQAARAEMSEELGLSDALPLRPAAHFYTEQPALLGKHPRRYVMLFRTRLETLPARVGTHEVAEVRWFTPDEIRQLVTAQPALVAEGLQHAYNYIFAREQADEHNGDQTAG